MTLGLERPIRVLVADDSELFRELLARIVVGEPGFEVVALAADGNAAAAYARDLKPDVITMDLNMPDADGFSGIARIMADTGKELSQLAGALVTYPQVLVNVRVKQKTDLKTVPAIAAAMQRVEERLAGNGRLLVRYSGTEPLLRIMLEGKDDGEIAQWANDIATVVKEQLA